MKYIVKCARLENPAKVDAQFLGTFDLPNEENDYLITDIVESMSGIGDCVFYYEEIETRNSSKNIESTETDTQQLKVKICDHWRKNSPCAFFCDKWCLVEGTCKSSR